MFPSRSIRRIVTMARIFARRAEGIAAVEFALIVPIMATLFIGAVELSQAITANRRVTQVGSTTGDLVARATDVSDTDVLDIMKVGSYLLAPYSTSGLKVDIRVVGSNATSATTTTLKWICSYDATNPNSVNCSCPNTAYTIPTGLVSTSDYVVIANVYYGYKPKLFDVFMKQYYGGANGVYTMNEVVYLKPRSSVPQLTIGSSPTKCGI